METEILICPGAMGLDEELNLIKRSLGSIVKHRIKWHLERVGVVDHVLHELLDHLSWQTRAIPCVLQNERTGILPVCLQTDLFRRATSMHRRI